MNEQYRELLLQDLCGRLPYGVKIEVTYSKDSGSSLRARLCSEGINTLDTNILWLFQQSEIYIKPYLFPLSSMTEEQKEELKDLTRKEMEIITDQLKTGNCGIDNGKYHFNNILELNWLNENNFDYRGLISKWLAIDCTGLNIYV